MEVTDDNFEDEMIQEGAGVVVGEKPLGEGAVVGVRLLPRCWVGLGGAVVRWVGSAGGSDASKEQKLDGGGV